MDPEIRRVRFLFIIWLLVFGSYSVWSAYSFLMESFSMNVSTGNQNSGGAWDRDPPGDPPKDWRYHSLPETVVRLDSDTVNLICQPNGDCSMAPTFTPHKKNLNEIVPELSKGQMVYNRLQTMWRGEPETVVLKIDLATPPALAEALPGERRHVETPVTPFMTADLNGTAGLEVEPSDPVRKRVSEIGTTPWQWTVTATDFADTEVLTLEVGIHLDDGDPYPLKSFEDEIEVKVTNLQLVGDVVDEFNPIWAFVVGAVPVAWGAFVWIRGRKWKQPETSSEWKPFSRRDRPDSATNKAIKKQKSD
ncbi:hypothetical protein [Roseibium album]|uniref:hypothetical protein n=1 Tax=Roseibium album TaxID=311410 RepID=UPI00391DFB91